MQVAVHMWHSPVGCSRRRVWAVTAQTPTSPPPLVSLLHGISYGSPVRQKVLCVAVPPADRLVQLAVPPDMLSSCLSVNVGVLSTSFALQRHHTHFSLLCISFLRRCNNTEGLESVILAYTLAY